MMKPLKDADRRDAGAPATKPAGEAGRGAGIGAELSSAVLSATLLAATAFLLRSCLLGGPIIDMQL